MFENIQAAIDGVSCRSRCDPRLELTVPSIRYLDSAINFCYTLIRTLELYSKDKGQIHIRKKRLLSKRNSQ